MARKVTARTDVPPIIRAYDGKTARVQVLLRPEDADKLRLSASALGVDMGDLVTSGIREVLRGVRISVQITQPAAGEGGAGPGAAAAGGPDLRVAG